MSFIQKVRPAIKNVTSNIVEPIILKLLVSIDATKSPNKPPEPTSRLL